MESKWKYSVASDSVIEINDESNSMYFSFDSTSDKTLEADKLTLDETDDFKENNDSTESGISFISTVKKCDPSMRNISKSILNDSKINSSTPTKYFSPRVLPKDKKFDNSLCVSLLRIKCLEKSENKENVNTENSSCTKKISEINLPLEKLKINNGNSDENQLKKIIVLPEANILRKSNIISENNKKQVNYSENVDQSKTQSTVSKKENSNNTNILKSCSSCSTVQEKLFNCSSSNKNSSISSGKVKSSVNCNNVQILENNVQRKAEKKLCIEALFNPIESAKLKIEKRRTINAAYTFPVRKSIINLKTINSQENNIIKRTPTFSISKTTLNSPGIINRNIRRKTINNIRKPIGQPKLFLNSPKKTSKISDNNRQSSSLVSGKLIPPILKLKKEIKFTPKECFVKSDYYNHKFPHEKNYKNNEYKCKFCDKTFAISKALQTHLSQNCTKISAIAKKKLLNQQSSNIFESQSTMSTPMIQFNSITPVSNGSFDANKGIQTEVGSMPPPTSTTIKKKIPHSGVYRTPTKLLICQICKQNFNNVYGYTEHSLSHSQEDEN